MAETAGTSRFPAAFSGTHVPNTASIIHEPSSVAPPSRFDRRKQAILEASGALFNRHGLRDTTLAMVAAEIGLNLKSLRYYYRHKEDLVAAAFRHAIGLHLALVDTARQEATREDRLRRFIQDYFALQLRVRTGAEPEFVHFGDLRALTEPQAADVFAAYLELFRALRSLLHDPATPWDRAMLNARTHLLLSQLLWSVVWRRYYLPEDFERIADRFLHILQHGIRPGVDLRGVPRTDLSSDTADGERLSRESFLRAATELINANGYRGASVDRISAALNVTKGAFYHHNDTKGDLVVACFERTFEVMRRAQNAAIVQDCSGIDRLAGTTTSLVEHQMKPAGTLLRTSALTAIDVHLRDEMTFRMNQLTARFEDMLVEAIGDGSAGVCDVRIAAQMVTGVINSAEELPRWVPTASLDNVAEFYVRPLFDGLLAPG